MPEVFGVSSGSVALCRGRLIFIWMAFCNWSSVKMPGRNRTGLPREQSMMVDSMPTSQAPPSKMSAKAWFVLSAKACWTCCAVVGLVRPKRLALGAAIPYPPKSSNCFMSSCATGCEGQRSPMVFCPPAAAVPTLGFRLTMMVSGPGQKVSMSCSAKSGSSWA